MDRILQAYRVPLKMQIVSWFLLSKSVGPHVKDYNRLIVIDEEYITINTYELSEFYQLDHIDEGKLNKWANSVVDFLAPKLSRFIYDLGEIKVSFDIKIIHRKQLIAKTIMLKSEL